MATALDAGAPLDKLALRYIQIFVAGNVHDIGIRAIAYLPELEG